MSHDFQYLLLPIKQHPLPATRFKEQISARLTLEYVAAAVTMINLWETEGEGPVRRDELMLKMTSINPTKHIPLFRGENMTTCPSTTDCRHF